MPSCCRSLNIYCPSKHNLCYIDSCTTGVNVFDYYLLDNNHSIAPIEEIIEVLQTTKKGRHVDTVEKFYMFKETRINNQSNEKNTVEPNARFEALLGPYKG
jgi:hypothetical protein